MDRPRWSDSEIEALANAAYRGQPLHCPRCSARVRAQEAGYAGRSSTPLDLYCQRCGASAEYSPDHLEEMKLEWSPSQKSVLVERYWATGRATCPQDGARLKTIESQTIGPPPANVLIRCPHCGRHFWSRDVEEAIEPDSFEGRYSTLDAIGSGGMGTVDLVEEKATGRQFAAKRIQPRFLGSSDAVRRFKRESRILTKLNHTNVVSIKETFLDESGGVILMDYVAGGTLTDAINGGAAPSDLVQWFAGVVEGLRYLHANGVVHRDLKPDNVLIDGTTARISDFGLATLLARDTTTLTVEGAFLGTRWYAAPEQQENASGVTTSCDIFSLGLIAYEIASGRSPYRMPVRTNELDPRLHDAIEGALAPEPGERPADGGDLLLALATTLSGAQPPKKHS